MEGYPRGSPCPTCQIPIVSHRILGQEVQAMPCGHALVSLSLSSGEPWWSPPTPATMRESQLQARVVSLAKRHGWQVYHTHDSRRSPPGFLDLELVRPPRLIKAELKREGEHPTVEQEAWLAAYRGVPGVEVFLWHPSDLQDIEGILE